MINVKLYKDGDGDWWAELPCEKFSVPGGCILGAGDTATLAIADLAKEMSRVGLDLEDADESKETAND